MGTKMELLTRKSHRTHYADGLGSSLHSAEYSHHSEQLEQTSPPNVDHTDVFLVSEGY